MYRSGFLYFARRGVHHDLVGFVVAGHDCQGRRGQDRVQGDSRRKQGQDGSLYQGGYDGDVLGGTSGSVYHSNGRLGRREKALPPW